MTDVLTALSAMMGELAQWIAEVDIDPLVVHADGHGATIADALVALRETQAVITVEHEGRGK